MGTPLTQPFGAWPTPPSVTPLAREVVVVVVVVVVVAR
jgi:hypothetical protein